MHRAQIGAHEGLSDLLLLDEKRAEGGHGRLLIGIDFVDGHEAPGDVALFRDGDDGLGDEGGVNGLVGHGRDHVGGGDVDALHILKGDPGLLAGLEEGRLLARAAGGGNGELAALEVGQRLEGPGIHEVGAHQQGLEAIARGVAGLVGHDLDGDFAFIGVVEPGGNRPAAHIEIPDGERGDHLGPGREGGDVHIKALVLEESPGVRDEIRSVADRVDNAQRDLGGCGAGHGGGEDGRGGRRLQHLAPGDRLKFHLNSPLLRGETPALPGLKQEWGSMRNRQTTRQASRGFEAPENWMVNRTSRLTKVPPSFA